MIVKLMTMRSDFYFNYYIIQYHSGNLRYRSEKVTHGRNSAHFVFSTFLTIFGYGESNAKSCQAKKIREIRLF